jgi:hypothetical protein
MKPSVFSVEGLPGTLPMESLLDQDGSDKSIQTMIKKAVFSYFNPDESFGNSCGFRRYSDFLFTTALSVFCASRYFKEVQFISSDWGIEVIKPLRLPITSYSNKLNELKTVSKHFWAYGKLLAYNEQTQPFVHLDNDVFLWKPLPDRILNARLCFQSQEPFNKDGYQYYNMLKPCFNAAPVKPQVIVDNEVFDYAYNCGICGGHDMKFFREWIETSAEYIFAPENEMVFFHDFADVLMHQNLFHEQYFAACLIKKNNLRKQVRVLHKDAMKINDDYPYESPAYTHLWGTTKTSADMMAKTRMSLLSANRALFDRVNRFCVKNNI